MKKQMRRTKCQDCGYKWETSSKLNFVSCPNCLRKVPNFPIEHKKEEIKKENGDVKNSENEKELGN